MDVSPPSGRTWEQRSAIMRTDLAPAAWSSCRLAHALRRPITKGPLCSLLWPLGPVALAVSSMRVGRSDCARTDVPCQVCTREATALQFAVGETGQLLVYGRRSIAVGAQVDPGCDPCQQPALPGRTSQRSRATRGSFRSQSQLLVHGSFPCALRSARMRRSRALRRAMPLPAR